MYKTRIILTEQNRTEQNRTEQNWLTAAFLWAVFYYVLNVRNRAFFIYKKYIQGGM